MFLCSVRPWEPSAAELDELQKRAEEMSRLVQPSEKADGEVDELMDEHLTTVAGGVTSDLSVQKKFSYSSEEDRFLLENYVKFVSHLPSDCSMPTCHGNAL